MSNGKKVVLIIMDGWGIGKDYKGNAITQANTPFFDNINQKYPHSELLTSGENVGLPDGQMGNSEVGHLNIGAGRIVYQDLLKINKAFADRSINKNKVLIDAFNYAKTNQKSIHFIGLVSDGGVHSHVDHLVGLCNMTKENGITENVFIHAFTDGRDTDPHSAINTIDYLQKHLDKSVGKIASIIGRYYAMDRDKRWERIKFAYDLLVNGKGTTASNAHQAIKDSYDAGITDEFIKPIAIVDGNNNPQAQIKNDHVVICFNFRTDRCREITMALSQQDFPEQEMHILNLHYITMTMYDHTFKNIGIVFEKDDLNMTLGEVLASEGKKQIRIAETEKYPHVTFFFSGGREKPFDGETRIMIPSPKVATYDLKPSMSAFEVKDAIVKELLKGEVDFVCLNFANADMVGHSGVFKAAVEAVETVDKCTKEVVEAGLSKDYSFIIISDHGNAEYLINDDGTPNTAHTKNPVPCILIDKDYKSIQNGKLCDIAPTILKIMGIKKPGEMTGKELV
jgi:2,3-bisphosphoglycerate-independent phosphoglycerate mutase